MKDKLFYWGLYLQLVLSWILITLLQFVELKEKVELKEIKELKYKPEEETILDILYKRIKNPFFFILNT